jgi:translocation and assembly module TamB
MKLLSFKTLRMTLYCLILTVISLFLFFFGSELGLKTTAFVLNKSKLIRIGNTHGTLLTGAKFDSLEFESEAITIQVKAFIFSVNLPALLRGELYSKGLKAKSILVELSPVLLENYNVSIIDPAATISLQQFSSNLSVNGTHLALENIHFQSNHHRWQGNGFIPFNQDKNSTLKLNNTQNPSEFIKIHQKDTELHLSIAIKHLLTLQGTIDTFFTKGHSTIKANLYKIQIKQNEQTLELVDNAVLLEGTLQDYQLKLQSKALINHSPLPYFINVETSGNPQQLSIKNAVIRHQAGKLNVNGRIHFSPTLSWQLNASANNFSPNILEPATLRSINLSVRSVGGVQNEQLTQETVINNLRFNLNGESFQGTAKLSNTLINASLSNKKNRFSISGDLQRTLQGHASINNYRFITPSLKALHGQTELKFEKDEHRSIRFGLQSKKLRYDFQYGKPIPLNNLELSGYLKGDVLNIQGNAESFNNSKAQLSLQVDKSNAQDFQKAALLGSLNLNIANLSWLDGAVPLLSGSKGTIKGLVQLSGTPDNPNVNSHLQLLDASTSIPDYDLKLSPITLSLNTEKENFTLNGQVYHQGIPLLISGQGNFKNFVPQARIELKATQLKLVDNENMSLMVSPVINIDYQHPRTKINGTIDIDHAKIVSFAASSSESLSEDVIIKGQTKTLASEQDPTLTYQLVVQAKDDVKVNLYGLTGTLEGKLTITGDNEQTPHALGQIEILNGKYQAYGQNLTVSKGKLLYTGGRISNPGINLSAIRKISNFAPSSQNSTMTETGFSPNFDNEIIAGIKLTGQLSHPHVSFFSNQGGLSQSDIFSLLVLGKTPSGGFSADEGKMLIGVLSNTTLGSHSSQSNLLGSLQHLIGLDDLSFETRTHHDDESNSDQEESFLVLGKRLTDKLQVQYGMGFGDSSYLIRFKYLLTGKWSLQVESQLNSSGFDIFYHYTRK